jgi:hypothetical protein
MRYVVLVAASLALATIQASALTGELLYRMCNDSKQEAYCEVYLRGYQDGMVAGRAWGSRTSCLPQKNMVVQYRLIVAKYLREHPEQLHVEAGLLVGFAIADAFPCLKNRTIPPSNYSTN